MSDDFLLDDDTIPPADPLNFDVNTTAIKPSSRRGVKAAQGDTEISAEDTPGVESTESLLEDELAEDSLDDEENMAYYMLGGEDSIEE